MKLRIVIHKAADNLFVANCPNLPGCAVEAETEKQARELLRAAINAYIISHKQRNEKLLQGD